MTAATHLDLYQLTSLVTHAAAGRLNDPVVMSFFSRKMPEDPVTGEPRRGALIFAGLTRIVAWLSEARFDEQAIAGLLAHPMLGPALATQPALVAALRDWRFTGQIRAPREGTPLFFGRAAHGGAEVQVAGVRPSAGCPYLEVRTDLLTAKLIETPILSLLNHMVMVASKAAEVVAAAGDRPVLEFGTRRTHPIAAVDASVAAWLGGVAATSNVEAHLRWGVPTMGTMDHFAVQAWERPGVPRGETERAFFEAFFQMYPGHATLLVDTYDTFGADTGIAAAVAATGGRLAGVRIDSGITAENLWRARRLLDALGAPHARIIASGGMDEHSIRALGDAPVDTFGVGERIVTSPDAPVGVGAVGKLVEVAGRPTMKLSRGSGKATLPGALQVWRGADGRDLVGTADEHQPGQPLLETVWDALGPRPLPSLAEARSHAASCLAALPEARRRPRQEAVNISAALLARIEALVAAG